MFVCCCLMVGCWFRVVGVMWIVIRVFSWVGLLC